MRLFEFIYRLLEMGYRCSIINKGHLNEIILGPFVLSVYDLFTKPLLLHKHGNELCQAPEYRHRFLEMRIDYRIKLFADVLEWPIQIERPDADLIATHPVDSVRLNFLFRFCIQEHARNFMRLASEFSLLVFYVGEDLVQVSGMDAALVEMLLRRVRVILRVNY